MVRASERAIITAIHKYNGRADGEGGWKWMNPKTVRAVKDEAEGLGHGIMAADRNQ